jgi:hypothetical protein
MRTVFGMIVLAALLLSHPAHAGVKQDCGTMCQSYKHAHSTGPVPYAGRKVCIWFKQARVDNVVLRFFDATGRELDANDPLHARRDAHTTDSICPGEHWLKKAARAQLCNSYESRWLERDHLAIMLQLGRTPPGKFVHLDLPR